MAQEVVDYQARIVRDPEVLVGKAVIKGTQVAVEHVLAALAMDPDPDAVVRDHPELTRDDIRAVLAYALDQIKAQDVAVERAPVVTPQQFYASVTQRPDVAELMRRLAR